VTPCTAATAVAPGAVAPLEENTEYVNAPTGPASTIDEPVVGTDVVAAPAVSVTHGVVFGLAIVGSVVIEFNNVTRSVLARHPNGVPDAAEAELASARRQMDAPSSVARYRAFPRVRKRRDCIVSPPRV
jgi:hypothetical protein